MDISINNVTTSVSLHLLINTIIQTNLPQINCFTILDKHSDLPLSVSPAITKFVINPPQTIVRGCNGLILYDPIISGYARLLLFYSFAFFNRNMTSIIILNIDTFKSYNASNLFARNAVFLQQNEEYFDVIVLNDWDMINPVVINKWNIKNNQFIHKELHFYDLKNRFKSKAMLRTVVYNYEPFVSMDSNNKTIGSDYNILVEFARVWEMKLEEQDGDSPQAILCGAPFQEGSIDVALQPTDIIAMIFMVPKPRIFVHWSQLFNVLPLELWMSVIVSFVFAAFYFWFQYILEYDQPKLKTLSIVGLFFSQGVNDTELQTRVRSRTIFGLVIMLTTLYAALFGSGIVENLIASSLENHIRTWKDLDESGLVIRCYNSYKQAVNYKDYKSNVLSRCNTSGVYRAKDVEAMMVGETPARFIIALEPFRRRSPNVTIVNLVAAVEYMGLQFADPDTLYLAPNINDFAIRTKEVGLYVKWEWEVYMKRYNMSFLLAFWDRSVPKTNVIELNPEHLKGAFGIWVCCIVVSTLIFWIELLQVHFQTYFV